MVVLKRGSLEFRQLAANSKHKISRNFGGSSERHALLQDHGNRVSVRNIKIRQVDLP